MRIRKRSIYIISIISFLFVVGLILLLYFFVIKKGSCTPNQCNNHGTCKDGICTCTSPYTGSDCSDTTSGCNPPCKNNKGTCNSKTNKCNCIFGKCGEDCSLSCGMNGICGDDNKCVCNPTYTGTICDKKCTDVCTKAKNPKYTGNCIDGGVCECTTGYAGPECKECSVACAKAKNPNYTGNCIDGDVCECIKGYTGPECTIKCNCSNKGICSNSDINSCICDIGWTGDKCENPTKFNEFKIVEQPIQNNSPTYGTGWYNNICDVNNYYQICADQEGNNTEYCSKPITADIYDSVKDASTTTDTCHSRL